MEKNEILFASVAIVAFAMGVVSFILGAYTNTTSILGFSAASLAAISFIIAELALSAKVSLANAGTGKFWSLENMAYQAIFLMAEGFILGFAMLVLYAITEFNPDMAQAIKHPTMGTMAVGLIGISVFLSLHGFCGVIEKDFWLAVQGFSTAGMVLFITIAAAGSLYLRVFSPQVADYCILGFGICMVLALAAVFIPTWRDKKAAKRFRSA